jgi:hypothetical protein
MKRKSLALYLVLGLLLGLLLTACAGVAAGQNGVTVGGPSIFGASIDSLAVPALDLAPAQAQPLMMRSLFSARELQQVQQLQQMQSLFHAGGCHGGDGYYGGDASDD